MNGRTVLEARIVTGEGGGPDKTILNTPRFMSSRGYPSVCLYLRPPGDPGFHAIEEKAARWDAPLEALDDSGPLDFGVLRRARELCDRHRPAIWHGHDYKTNFLGLLLARKRPMVLVTTLHGWVKHTWKTPFYYALDRRCIRRYAAIMAVSEDLHQSALECGAPPDRCFLVPNAIDCDEFRRTLTNDEAKERRGFRPGGFLIGAAGRLSPEKGFDLLIEAVARLNAEGLAVHLQIAGEGDDRARLERLIRERNLSDRVTLLGFQSDLSLFYQSLDAFVLSSIREGLPNVVLEAMAIEVPILATRVAGAPSVIHDNETGMLVEPGSSSSLAGGLRRLLQDGALRARLAAAARRLVASRFGLAQRMDRMKEIYDFTLAREGRP